MATYNSGQKIIANNKDLETLRQVIKQELDRRSNPGIEGFEQTEECLNLHYSKYSDIAEPMLLKTAGELLTIAYANDILDALVTTLFGSNDTLSTIPQGTLIQSLQNIYTVVNTLTSFSGVGNDTGCAASCVGFCYQSCLGNCGGCTSTSQTQAQGKKKDSLPNDASWNSSKGCGAGSNGGTACGTCGGCSNVCGGDCHTSCNNMCHGTCGNQCNTTCTWTCNTICSSACGSECRTTCSGSCLGAASVSNHNTWIV